MKKKLLVLLMLIALIIFAAACTGTSDDAEPTVKPTIKATTEPTATPEPTAEPTATPEPTAEPEKGTNVAIGKPVEVSSSTLAAGSWDPTYVNDGIVDNGDGTTMGWTSQVKKYLDNEEFNEFVIIDLENETNISAIYLWPRQDAGNEGIYFPVDYKIEVSNDKTTWTSAYTKEGDTGAEEMSIEARKIFLENVKGRYVRVLGTKLTDANAAHAALDGPLMQIGEIEIYSKG